MSREKGADEVFCRSCGEAIKEEAEICPECGVRNANAKAPGLTRNGTNRTVSTAHDPNQYETTVSENWWHVVLGATILWGMVWILEGVTPDAMGVIIGFLALIAWVCLPVAAYFDMQYIRANSKWNPDTIVWVVILSIWFVNLIAGVVYLYRRREVLGDP